MLLSSPVGTHISNCNHSYRVVSQLVGMVRYEDLGKPKVGYHTKRTEGPARNVKQRGASVTLDVVDLHVVDHKTSGRVPSEALTDLYNIINRSTSV